MNGMMRLSPKRDRRGFTLLELLIAMVIIAIGILATMAMQYSALAGYSAARDATLATEMAHSVEQIIQADARGWEVGTDPSSTSIGPSGYFDAAFANGGGWTNVDDNDEPVTLRHNARDDESGDDGAEKFCVYAAAETLEDDELDDDDPAQDQQDDGFARIGVAVVYPAANNPMTNCPNTDEIDSSQRQELELQGFRAIHVSTGVMARGED